MPHLTKQPYLNLWRPSWKWPWNLTRLLQNVTFWHAVMFYAAFRKIWYQTFHVLLTFSRWFNFLLILWRPSWKWRHKKKANVVGFQKLSKYVANTLYKWKNPRMGLENFFSLKLGWAPLWRNKNITTISHLYQSPQNNFLGIN